MWMHRSTGATMRSIGKPAFSLGAPTSALRAALRFGLWVTPHPERRLLPNTAAGVHGCSKALASTYAGLGVPAVHGSSAAVLPAGTLPPPLLSAPAQLFSTSTGTGDKSAKPVKGGKRRAAVVPSVVLVKVGDGGKWGVFEHDELLGMHRTKLLEALASSKVFGLKLQGIDLSGCSVSVFKLPAGTDEPTADDEACASELKGAKTVGITADAKPAGIKAGSITKNDQICIRVRLPDQTGATPTAASAPGAVDDETRRFMDALPHATRETLRDGCELLTLPNAADGTPVEWPNLASNKLIVRPSFREFYEKEEYLNEFRLGRNRRNWLLRGIPGIGKSSFGLYCLWRLVKAGRRVRYWYPRGSTAVMDFGSSTGFDAYIVDGAAPGSLMRTPTLLISSPRGGAGLDGVDKSPIYDDFEKRPLVQHLYMKPPTTPQLLLLGSTCYPDVPKPHILECIGRWGPVIRPIFGVEPEEEKAALTEAIQMQKVSALKHLACSMSEKVVIKDVSFRVVHYNINDTHRSINGFMWASDYIEQQVFEVLLKADLDDRLTLLQEMLSRKSSLAMCQKLFEEWCNLVMQRGSGGDELSGGFRVRRLGVGKLKGDKSELAVDDSVLKAADKALGLSEPAMDGIYRLQVQAAKTLFLSTPDDLDPSAVDKQTRWKANACFAAADFVEATGVCSNATVSDTHELLLQGVRYNNGLRAILEHLQPTAVADGSTDIVPFVWLVPALVFPHFTVGSQVVETSSKDGSSDGNTKLKAARATAHQLGKRVVQYVLEIPNPQDFKSAWEGKQQQHGAGV